MFDLDSLESFGSSYLQLKAKYVPQMRSWLPWIY